MILNRSEEFVQLTNAVSLVAGREEVLEWKWVEE
jgi:hypothetical protein